MYSKLSANYYKIRMKMNRWRYYDHATLPNCVPHEECDMTLFKDGTIWKLISNDGRHPLLVRFTTDFDCKEETSFWYIIKDGGFLMDDFNKKCLKSIRKALERCDVRLIDPIEYADEIYNVYIAAFKEYKNADKEQCEKVFKNQIKGDGLEYWGAFIYRIEWIVKSIYYPIRKILWYLDSEPHIHQINCLLRMEEIVRDKINTPLSRVIFELGAFHSFKINHYSIPIAA